MLLQPFRFRALEQTENFFLFPLPANQTNINPLIEIPPGDPCILQIHLGLGTKPQNWGELKLYNNDLAFGPQ